MRFLEKALFTLAGGLLAFNGACSPVAVPTPTRAIQLQSPSVQPTPVPTATSTSIAPTRHTTAPTSIQNSSLPKYIENGNKLQPIALYRPINKMVNDAAIKTGQVRITKIFDYAWQRGINLMLTTEEDEDILKRNRVKGVLIDPNFSFALSDYQISDIAEFVRNGGIVYFEINDDDACHYRDIGASLREHFNISIVCESVKSGITLYDLTEKLFPWSNGLVTKIEAYKNDDIGAFFFPKGDYRTANVISEETGKPRAIAAYRRMDGGEIFFYITPSPQRSIINDEQIDRYQNLTAIFRVLMWLGGGAELREE